MHKLPALLLPFMAACMIFSSCGTTAPLSSQEESKTEKILSEETPKDSEPESQPEEEKAGPIHVPDYRGPAPCRKWGYAGRFNIKRKRIWEIVYGHR